MTVKTRVLVVANRTAGSRELREALLARAARGACAFTLVVPADYAHRDGTRAHLEGVVAELSNAGLEVDGKVGDGDPMLAVADHWSPGSFDEIVVSTLPTSTSRWLQIDLPHRIGRLTGAPVTHVTAAAPSDERVSR